MIRNLFYTILIMTVLGLLLLVGLQGPDYEKKTVQSVRDFLHLKTKRDPSPLKETERKIEEFNESIKRIQVLREMTIKRHEQTAQELDQTYKDLQENLKELL